MDLAEGCVRAALRALLDAPGALQAASASMPAAAAATSATAAGSGAALASDSDLAYFAARVDAAAARRVLDAAATGGFDGGGGGAPAVGPSCRPGAAAEAAAAGSRRFARMTYTDAVAALQRAATAGRRFARPVDWHAGLALEHERWLAEEHVRGPVFVTDYPAAVKAFYMRANEDTDGARGAAPGPTVAAFDLLVPGVGELAGGSAREERWERLAPRMAAAGLLSPAFAAAAAAPGGAAAAAVRALPPADCGGATLDWYLDLRRFGSAPHAGWGLGFDRLLLFAAGLDNIRDAVPVPRVPGSCRM